MLWSPEPWPLWVKNGQQFQLMTCQGASVSHRAELLWVEKQKKKVFFVQVCHACDSRVFQSCSWGSPAAHVRDVALPQHTWFKLMARYGASAELHDEPIIWIRCVGTGKHLQHAGQETLRNRTAVTWAFGSCKLCKENTQIQIHVIAFLSTDEMQNITKPLNKITRETIKE